ncbi:MAG: VPLPA-CTERM sorting domain-containing protein [Pseudomonadota bacterium]
MNTRLPNITPWISLCILLFASTALAESLNIDIGTRYNALPDTYAAASGQAGFWNDDGLSFNDLVDINNIATDVDLSYSSSIVDGWVGGTSLTNEDYLQGDNFFVFSGAWALTLSNLDAGTYDVYYYAPGNPGVTTGAMTINGTLVGSLTGQLGPLVQGTSWDVLTDVVVDGSNTLVIAATGTSGARGLAGLQIVSTTAVPLPAAFWMLGGGVLAICGFCRRR